MAKLIDLSAIYGHSNQETITKIISNVFENDKRYIVDFEECLKLILNLLKKNFKDTLKINSLISGDSVY